MDLVEIRKKARDRQKEKKVQAKPGPKPREKDRKSTVAQEVPSAAAKDMAPAGAAPFPEPEVKVATEKGRPKEPVKEPVEPRMGPESPSEPADEAGFEEPVVEPAEKTGETDMAARSKDSGNVPAPASDRTRKSPRVDEDGFASLKEVLQSQHDEKREDDEEEVLQILTFMLGHEEYGLNIMDIKEIVRPKDPTEVPRAPHYVLGIISLRGTIIPIFDVKRRLGLANTERSSRNRVIVVKWQEHLFGLLVDSVVQVMDLPISRIDPPPEILGGVEGEFLRGVGKVDDRLIILLNLSRILALDHAEPTAELELTSGARQR